ncbi:hypothetical protein ASPWEDRAFT_49228 [Aspergillus wentii DTO 134E9]|uniref:BHLH domain-containing protein n=1 Tax=Aspergillus wentii DTO 134E9 TaxID=1073089 RepID=A0A1L9RWC4_ASPWE|nr:uncharacterized protein ASPWEDRAFT_49228 [Aspergillus wentii DTO 134E9]OJJ39183.1 hypothetical protein ASPWEDRAFT_49228 [Aspergillus wentii DTO 134E9]
MWDKVPFYRSRRPTVGTPTLGDKTADDGVYQTLSSARVRNDNSTFSPNRPRVASAPHPSNAVEQLRQRSSTLTPLGQSGYTSKPGTPSSWLQDAEISPPDSPISMRRTPNSRGSSQVSPIEDEPNQYFESEQTENRFASHLPVLRQGEGNDNIPSRSDDSQNSYKLSSSRARETRWDDFSGEPTAGSSGKSAQMTPGRTSFYSQGTSKPGGPQTSGILGWGKEQFQPRKKLAEARSRLSKNDNMLQPAAREPWKGPSGRSPMINPIQEKLRKRSPSPAQPSKSSSRGKDNNVSPDANLVSLGIKPSVVTTITGGAANPAGPERRTVSKNISRHQPEKPEPTPATSVRSSTPPRIDLPEPDLTATLADLKLTGEDQPGSRFSAATYTPTEVETATSTGSPRESIDISNLSTDNLASIMSRKRPVPSAVAPGKMPAKMPVRKPTPSQAPEAEAMPKESSPESPRQHTQNRIDALEARRDTLMRRRTNINTIIHELTQVVQPSSIAYDMAAREEVKKTVASLNNELAEIKREEHEIGVKLLRLWKKCDEQDAYGGGTGLWVKRVTS